MKVAVIGSRTFTDYALLEETLKHIYITELISGEAEGADKLAKRYAAEHNIPFLEIPHDPLPIHNRTYQIISRAQLVIAFWDGKSQGTCDLIKYAQKLNKQMRIKNFKAA
jgi:hypothetical protein